MPDTSQIICGVDPGLQRTGYGVLRVAAGTDAVELVDAGVIRCSRSESLARRLVELAAGLDEVLAEYRVGVLAVEEIYSHYRRPQTAILMAHARGVILLEAARREVDVVHLPSTTVKRHVTGNGRASKEQVQRAVADQLRLSRLPEPTDVSDAIAIGLSAVYARRQPAHLVAVAGRLGSR